MTEPLAPLTPGLIESAVADLRHYSFNPWEKARVDILIAALAEAQERVRAADDAIEFWRWENRKSLDQRDAAQAEAAKLREALTWARRYATGFDHDRGCAGFRSNIGCTCGYVNVPFGSLDTALAAPPSTAATPEGRPHE